MATSAAAWGTWVACYFLRIFSIIFDLEYFKAVERFVAWEVIAKTGTSCLEESSMWMSGRNGATLARYKNLQIKPNQKSKNFVIQL